MNSNRNIPNPVLEQLKLDFTKIIQNDLLSFSNVVNISFQRLETHIASLERTIQSNRPPRQQPSTSVDDKQNICWFHRKYGIFATDCDNKKPNKKKCNFTPANPTTPDQSHLDVSSEKTISSPQTPGRDLKRKSLPQTMDELFGTYSPSPEKKWDRKPSIED